MSVVQPLLMKKVLHRMLSDCFCPSNHTLSHKLGSEWESERASKWARAKGVVWSKWMSERCERPSQRKSKWSSTYVPTLSSSDPLCQPYHRHSVSRLTWLISCLVGLSFCSKWKSLLGYFSRQMACKSLGGILHLRRILPVSRKQKDGSIYKILFRAH